MTGFRKPGFTAPPQAALLASNEARKTRGIFIVVGKHFAVLLLVV